MTSVIVTPDTEGLISTIEGTATIPVSAYVEAPLPPNIETIPDIYLDLDKTTGIERKIVETSRQYGDDINEIISGSRDPSLAPLSYDLTLQLAQIAADRAMRLAAIEIDSDPKEFIPQKLIHQFNYITTADIWRAWSKKQSYQWMVLRILAGTDDRFKTLEPSFWRRKRTQLGRWRQDRMALRTGGHGLHCCYLARHEQVMKKLGEKFIAVPSMVLDHGNSRNKNARRAIIDAGVTAFAPLLEACGISGERAQGLARLMGRVYPESRLECRNRNFDLYKRYFDRWSVKGLITATGHTWHDRAAYFWTECNHRNLPSVILQHGGQYGYDDKQPGFFALDQTLPTHFVSWGWDKYSKAFDGLDRRARIVPMPDARLSEIAKCWKPGQKREKLLIVPLSKFRSLEVRFGSIACDGRLMSLRQITADVIKQSTKFFEKIIVTYRNNNFDDDPLSIFLKDCNKHIEILSARDVSASQLFDRAAAVFWDVTATGPFESLIYNLPTVVLMREGRWAPNASEAEKKFIESGIGVLTAENASENLIRFAGNDDAWEDALTAVESALQTYACTANDWKDQWRNFLLSLKADDIS